MAILRIKEIKNMDDRTLESKLKDLKMEMIKANVNANKARAKTREIKRVIARLVGQKVASKNQKLLEVNKRKQ